MSISVLDNPPDDLVKAIKDSIKRKRKMAREIRSNNERFRRGVRAYLEGFRLLEESDPQRYHGIEYYTGWMAAQKRWPEWPERRKGVKRSPPPRQSKERMMPTSQEIYDAFYEAEEEFGEDKSTEFLLSITADRLGIEYEDVVDGLLAKSEELGGEE